MKKALSAVLALLVVLAIPVGSRAQPTETLKIGTVLPLNFGMGVDTKKALEMLVADFNAAGGITIKGKQYKFDLTVYDDKWKAEEGRAAIERLIYQDKINFMISIITSPTIVSGLSLFESEKVFNFCSGSTPKLLNPKLHYTFGTSTTRTSVPPLWAMVERAFPKAKTVVFISPNDEGGKARAAAEKKVAEAFGVKVIDTLTYERDTVDFTSIAAKAVSYNPDLIDYPGADTGTQFGLQIKAVHAAGLRGGRSLPSTRGGTKCARSRAMGCGRRVAQTTPTPMAEGIGDGGESLKGGVCRKYGKWSDASLPWIPAWYALIAAIEKADSVDSTVIAEMIEEKGLEWQRVDGLARMVRRPDQGNLQYCDSVAETAYAQIQNGKVVPLGRLSVVDVMAANERVFGGGAWK